MSINEFPLLVPPLSIDSLTTFIVNYEQSFDTLSKALENIHRSYITALLEPTRFSNRAVNDKMSRYKALIVALAADNQLLSRSLQDVMKFVLLESNAKSKTALTALSDAQLNRLSRIINGTIGSLPSFITANKILIGFRKLIQMYNNHRILIYTSYIDKKLHTVDYIEFFDLKVKLAAEDALRKYIRATQL
jgi:hypothetical protein